MDKEKLIEFLEKLKKEPIPYSEDPNSDSGGNFDDAYSIGCDKGEIDGANEVIEKVLNYIKL
jgi:hypothetical protein